MEKQWGRGGAFSFTLLARHMFTFRPTPPGLDQVGPPQLRSNLGRPKRAGTRRPGPSLPGTWPIDRAVQVLGSRISFPISGGVARLVLKLSRGWVKSRERLLVNRGKDCNSNVCPGLAHHC